MSDLLFWLTGILVAVGFLAVMAMFAAAFVLGYRQLAEMRREKRKSQDFLKGFHPAS